MSTNKPYKGPESYQPEDADLFFGREGEANQLLATILSASVTLLYAPSGAGKTSLLNARIIPNLDAHGWHSVRVLPQDNPIESVRISTLRSLFPPPQTEVAALERALSTLGESTDASLGRLLTAYDALEIRDPRRRELLSPVESPDIATAGAVPAFGLVTPFLCRLLQQRIEIGTLADHLTAMWRAVSNAPVPLPDITLDTPAAELRQALTHGDYLAAYSQLLSRVYVPVAGLLPFFDNLFAVYGGARSRLSLALILDQFEELFTRFVDLSPVVSERTRELPDWRLRPRFFEELQGLVATGIELPIRYVISIREEYIARLDPIRTYVPELDATSFHLELLDLAEAKTAIQEPARRYGYDYSEECYTGILGQLVKYRRFVEPSHLQIVCEKLWNERGSGLAHAASGDADKPQVSAEALQQLGGVAGILASFLREFLDTLSQGDRFEALEMLDLLITSSGTRNIVERSHLVEAPFRSAARRDLLLNRLVSRSIVRTEWRLGGYFVEITHEFLIQPIRDEMLRESLSNPVYWRLRDALAALQRFARVDFRDPSAQLLAAGDFRAIAASRDAIEWNPWSAELMLRSALLHCAARNELAPWAALYERSGELPATEVLLRDAVRAGQKVFSRDEMCAILEHPLTGELGDQEIELVLRSLLLTGLRENREAIRSWARRLD